MCQLLGVSASAPLKLGFSWRRFALRGSAAAGNPDGWGVAYLDDTDVHLLREPSPAADSAYVAFLESHGPASNQIISHVRRATIGERTTANTQPFVRRLGGQVHVFAHNGQVPVADISLPSPWLQPTGQTDSEVLFCELLSQLEPLWRQAGPSTHPSLAARAEVIADWAAQTRQRGALNFLYADGATLFVHSHRKTLPGADISSEPGLYRLQRQAGDDSVDSLCEGLRNSPSGAGDCVSLCLVATMPLDDQPWVPLSSGELVCFERGVVVSY